MYRKRQSWYALTVVQAQAIREVDQRNKKSLLAMSCDIDRSPNGLQISPLHPTNYNQKQLDWQQ